MKHTPGPWRIEDVESMQPYTEYDVYAGDHRVMHVHDIDDGAEANARLIASAPELLEALTETLRALEAHLDEACRDHGVSHRDLLCPCNQNEVVRARAAIAKATGKEG